MRKIITGILLISGVLLQFPLTAQLVGVRPKLFTLRNARISLGLYANGNWTNAEGKNALNFFTGKLPDDLSIKFESNTFPLVSGGLQFDVFAPNSILSLSFGAGYHAFNFQLADESSRLTQLEIQSLQIPAYLKFELGKIHAPVKGLFMAGVIYSRPIAFQGSGPGGNWSDTSPLSATYSPSVQAGIQFRFLGEEKEKFAISKDGSLSGEYTRLWLFLRGDLLTQRLFQDTFSISAQQQGPLDYRDLNITIGLAFFFGLSKE